MWYTIANPGKWHWGWATGQSHEIRTWVRYFGSSPRASLPNSKPFHGRSLLPETLGTRDTIKRRIKYYHCYRTVSIQSEIIGRENPISINLGSEPRMNSCPSNIIVIKLSWQASNGLLNISIIRNSGVLLLHRVCMNLDYTWIQQIRMILTTLQKTTLQGTSYEIFQSLTTYCIISCLFPTNCVGPTSISQCL